MEENDRLSEKQEIALVALLAGKTRRQAAKLARVSEVTIYRWLNGENFKAQMIARQKQIFDLVAGQLIQLGEKAVVTLNRNLKCGHPPTETRAALGILAQAVRLRNDEIVTRLEKLESVLSDESFYAELGTFS